MTERTRSALRSSATRSALRSSATRSALRSSATRSQLFIDEGLDALTARIAAEASYLPLKERTTQQQEAVKKASDAIAANAKKLAQDEASTKDLSRPGADYSPTTHNESQGLKPS